MNEKKKEAAPEGPPRDLVHGRGQKPAEAPQGNLSMSHEEINSGSEPQNQAEAAPGPDLHALLTPCLSEKRLGRYAAAARADGVTPEALYLWNCDLGQAFYLAIHMAEVSTRNTIHGALLYRDENWFANRTFRGIVAPGRLRALDDAVAEERAKHGASFDAHHLVGSVSFGFWEHLAELRFQRYLFPRGVQRNFKHAPLGANVRDLHDLIQSVRLWRNRIAHYKALFDKGPSAKYQDALTLISWTSPELAQWVSHRCGVQQIINRRPGRA